jgi:hypothetical protein
MSQPTSLQDRRKQQLRLINEKLAKRHSLQQKELSPQPGKTPAQFGSPEVTNTVQGSPNVSVSDGSLVRKTALMQPMLSQEAPGKSVAYRPTLYSDPNRQSLYAAREVDQSTLTGVLTLSDPLPTAVHPAPDGDLLDSESSFLPVTLLRDASPNQSGHEDPTSQLEGDHTDTYINSLLSSLNSAYGYSSLAEKSRLLNTLVGSERVPLAQDALPLPDYHGETIKIQAAYRGHLARRNFRKHCRELKAASLIQATW